jgi:hypothetical protein
MAQRRSRDLDSKYGAGMGDRQITDGFGKRGSAGGHGVLRGERTDQPAPLGVGEAHVDSVVSWIGHRRSSALAH